MIADAVTVLNGDLLMTDPGIAMDWHNCNLKINLNAMFIFVHVFDGKSVSKLHQSNRVQLMLSGR